MHIDLTTVITTLATVLVGGCFNYLRSINSSIKRAERRDFAQDLHILDHERRLKDLEPRKAS